MRHNPYLNQSQPSKEPSSLFGWKALGNQVRRQGTEGEMSVHLRQRWMIWEKRVLLMLVGVIDKASRLTVVNDKSHGSCAC